MTPTIPSTPTSRTPSLHVAKYSSAEKTFKLNIEVELYDVYKDKTLSPSVIDDLDAELTKFRKTLETRPCEIINEAELESPKDVRFKQWQIDPFKVEELLNDAKKIRKITKFCSISQAETSLRQLEKLGKRYNLTAADRLELLKTKISKKFNTFGKKTSGLTDDYFEQTMEAFRQKLKESLPVRSRYNGMLMNIGQDGSLEAYNEKFHELMDSCDEQFQASMALFPQICVNLYINALKRPIQKCIAHCEFKSVEEVYQHCSRLTSIEELSAIKKDSPDLTKTSVKTECGDGREKDLVEELSKSLTLA